MSFLLRSTRAAVPVLRRAVVPARNFVTVVHQAELAYRELLGSNRVKLEPGLRLRIPFLHSIKRVNLREDSVRAPRLHAYTRDNVPVMVSAAIFYTPVDAEKICYKITDLPASLQVVSESVVRSVVGRFTYDEATAKRSELSTMMLESLSKNALDWGVRFTRLEVDYFGPQNQHVQETLEKQMKAERERRENELNTQAAIRTAEGAKQSAILKAEAESKTLELHSVAQATAATNRAKAEAYELKTRAEALAGQLAALREQTSDPANFLLELKRLEHLRELATKGNSVYFVAPDSIFPVAKVVTDLIGAKRQ